MIIDRMHAWLATFSGNFQLDVLANPKVVESVEQSLADHGLREERKMPLKAPLVFWLVILLALRRDRSVPNAFAALVCACRALVAGLSRKAVTDGGLARARQRLGAEPFHTFFLRQAEAEKCPPWFHGLRPCALDGVRLTMPDTDKNRERFPKQKTGRGKAAWPQMLAVCLLDIATRRLAAANFDNIHSDERTLGRQLWEKLGPHDLLIVDRGFFKTADLWQLDREGRHFVCKLPGNPKFTVLQTYGPGDFLVELRARCPLAEGEEPEPRRGRRGKTKKIRLLVRLIAYRINGVEHRLLTNVRDRSLTPAELADLYHWRWDVELAYDELKVHFMAVIHGKAKTVFRSKSPALVEQEFWAMLSAYNLVRGLMAEAAKTRHLDPLKLSFTDSLAVIEDSLGRIQRAAAVELPSLHRQLLRDLAECRLDRPRRERQCPRVVKVKMSNFPVKQAHHHGSRIVLRIELTKCLKSAS